MNLRWLVKQDGSRVLQQIQDQGFYPEPTTETSARLPGTTVKFFAWVDIPEVRETESDLRMQSEENSA